MSTSPSQCWNFAGLNPCRSCACCHNLSEFICVSVLFCLEDSIFLESSIASGFYTLFLPPPSLLYRSIPDPGGGGLMETSYLGLSSLKSLTLCTLSQLWISVLITISRKKNLLWWGLSDILICGYSNMSLGVILSLYFFSSIVLVSFSLMPMTYQVTYSWPI